MRARLILLALVLLLVFAIGGWSAVGSTLRWMAVGLAVALAVGWLAMWLVRRKVRKEMRRLQDTLLGRLGSAAGPSRPSPPPHDEAIDADFQVRK